MSAGDDHGRAESIRHRLRNALRARGHDVTLGLQRYAVERFLYRLGASSHRTRFVLKGATLFAIWGTTYRPTRDLDFTGYGSPDRYKLVEAFREICNTPDEVDELLFDTDAITANRIRDGSEYDGYRVRVTARLGRSKIPLQVDVGFGNAIVPGPEERVYRTLLGDPPPRILAYPPESVVAEKMHAMAILGERNSRYKDFHDIHAMARAFRFGRDTLARAVRATFERRSTPLTADNPAALTERFYSDASRAAQWRAYVARNDLSDAPSAFGQVGDLLVPFLQPIWRDLHSGRMPLGDWPPGGPWKPATSPEDGANG